MLVVHGHWTDRSLRLWAESLPLYLASHHARSAGALEGGGAGAAVERSARDIHPFALPADALRQRLARAGALPAEMDQRTATAPLAVRLPSDSAGPRPSDRLLRAAGAVEDQADLVLAAYQIETLRIEPAQAATVLTGLEEHAGAAGAGGGGGAGGEIELGQSARYWIAVARFVLDLLADQRFVPALLHANTASGNGGAGRANGLRAAWEPWLQDDEQRRLIGALIASMPPIVRAVENGHAGQPWAILHEAILTMTDAWVRSALVTESFLDALDGRDAARDSQVAWLRGLLGNDAQVGAPQEMAAELMRDSTAWIGRLDDTGQNQPLHLCLKLDEPDVSEAPAEGARAASEPVWRLSLHLQAAEDSALMLDAVDIWRGAPLETRVKGRRIPNPQELLLAELGRASRLYPKIESALAERNPTHIDLTTAEAYEFLREVRPVLQESGVSVLTPAWWNQPAGRLGARLHIAAPALDAVSGTGAAQKLLGLNTLVEYRWQIAIGDHVLTMEEFNELARQNAPLVRVRGKWIEISGEHLAGIREFLAEPQSGQMTLLEAIQVAHGAEGRPAALPVFGLDASGWVADVLHASREEQRMPLLDQPGNFHGTLRPYQRTGLSWLAFLEQYGLGACLADDMGLGKTIQFIALMLQERRSISPGLGPGDGEEVAHIAANPPAEPGANGIGPTLLIVPTSVIGNWSRELGRFAPSLRAHVHHGPARAIGPAFEVVAAQHDLIITTYPLISRDAETLVRVRWHRVALDEAQYIKNPPTKQTTAIRALSATRRLALTGTPVENRLSELWSIMEFLNPGYLGSAGEFRRRFAMPIERHRNQRQAERLRQMVRPFVLRRLKTDPTVIDDLPECLETKEFATLTPEQATLYQRVVDQMLGEVDVAEGMQRRGLVLATLVKLKQICNHPAQYLAAPGRQLEHISANGAPSTDQDAAVSEVDAEPLPAGEGDEEIAAVERAPANLSARSGKAKRLLAMLEEVLATGEKSLIFTQFRQMGHLLTSMIERELDTEVLFLHGGTPAAKRQHLIDRFQLDTAGPPVFVLSLKAGGLGLNLAAANHVFHFDRWWNPAVENQATDRAYRIGQTRNVHVHKFVCVGTLEERIDQMIEQKMELAQNIIGAGEQWLTELSTRELHDLLILRESALEVET